MPPIRLYLNPLIEQCSPETGIGRVALAQYKYLPQMGFEITTNPHQADVIACHVNRPEGVPRVDALHIHGLNWADTPHWPYQSWYHNVNRYVIQSIREARAVTVPSPWVAVPLLRDMRIVPKVFGHGIEWDEWQNPAENLGYILWNKNRNKDVCDPNPAYELARMGVDTISTFAPKGKEENLPEFLRITGLLSAGKMKVAIQCADIYLATTMETFGIGTLEALASGVPVLGYDWGGTANLVRHGVDGYLVEPGDIQGLYAGREWIRKHRPDLSRNARERAGEFTWPKIMEQYAALYFSLAQGNPAAAGSRVSVVVPCYKYGKFLPACIQSLENQTVPPDEIIIVDDCSPDDSRDVASRLASQNPRIKLLFHETNQGVAAARNNGISLARNPYIICLDADDQLHPDYIAICQESMVQDPSLGIVYTGLEVLYENGQVGQTQWPPEFDWEIMTTVTVPPSNCIPSAAMFRKPMWERAGGYRQIYAPAEDTEFWVRGLSVGFNAQKVSSAPLFLYRAHAESASRTKKYHAIDLWHPWMRDKQYPMGSPQTKKPVVRSYAFPTVSVIIPVGPGHDQYLPAALDSLLGQSYRNWEVIVVDDTGDFPSLEYKSQLRPYPFIKVVPTEGGHGAGLARNIGLNYAKSPMVLFLDADDYLDPQALEKMVGYFAENGGRYVYSDWVEVGPDGPAAAHTLDFYDPRVWLERFVSGQGGLNAITVLMATVDAKKIRFDETLPGWEDSDFFARCGIAGIHGVHLAEPLLYYRVNTGGRRKLAMEFRETLLAQFQKNYGPYLKGELPMSTCCGGSASTAILAAKRAMGLIKDDPIPVPNNSPDTISFRMEYTGEQTGPSTYWGNNGRFYRGANSPMNKYINAHPDDVEKLENTGFWRRVGEEKPADVAGPQFSPISQEERRLAAEKALEKAKAAFLANEPDPVDEAPAAADAAAIMPGAMPAAVQSDDQPKKKPGRKPGGVK